MTHVREILSVLLGEAEQLHLPLNSPEASFVQDLANATAQDYINQVNAANAKKVDDYDISYHGVMASDYFQGCGTSFTSYESAYTGAGNNAYDAVEDAIEQAASDGWDTSSIKNDNDPEDADNVENAARGANPDADDDDIGEYMSDINYYVCLRVKAADPIQLESQGDMMSYMVPEIDRISTNRKLRVGEEVSDRTFHIPDLCRRGLDKLKELHYDGWKKFVSINQEPVELLKTINQLEGDEAVEAHEAVEALWDAIVEELDNYYCPFGTFFGSNPGCGSCYGCWPAEDYLNDLAAEETTLVKMDENSREAEAFLAGQWRPTFDESDTEYVWIIGERGNTALYKRDGELVWKY